MLLDQDETQLKRNKINTLKSKHFREITFGQKISNSYPERKKKAVDQSPLALGGGHVLSWGGKVNTPFSVQCSCRQIRCKL